MAGLKRVSLVRTPHLSLTEFNSAIKYLAKLDTALNIVKITAKFQRHLQ